MNLNISKFILKSIILTFILFNISNISYSQINENAYNTWYFGDRAGVDFNSAPPVALTDGNLNTQEGVANVSNEFGELLFYTDGVTIWDSTHQPMPNANGTLNGHFSSTQSALIVPNPDNSDIYYVFTTDELAGPNGLSYTVIDMTLQGNGGVGSPLGDAVNGQTNIQIASPVTEKLTAVLNASSSSIWVIAHGWNNNNFLSYKVTCNGVDPMPVISSVGNVQTGGTNNINSVGYLKASQNGEKLALVNRNINRIEVYDFDKNQGLVSNELEIIPNDALLYGLEFSPNGEFLYIGGSNSLSKYSFSSNNLTNISIDSNAPFSSSNVIRALQLGPDGNIYVSIRNWEYLSVINNPDDNVTMLTTNGIFLDPNNSNRKCRFGLPNNFQFELVPYDSIPNITITTCSSTPVIFNGNTYLAGTVNEIYLTNSNGCDSLIILNVEEVNDIFNTMLYVESCEGSYYQYNGTQVLAGTQQSFNLTTSNGCDSIVTLNVEEIPKFEQTISVEVCEGESYSYNGTQVMANTQQDFNFIASNGCDSIITLIVTGVEQPETNLVEQVCLGSFYSYNGIDYPAGTDTSLQILNQNGCIETINLLVSTIPNTEFDLTTQNSCPNINNGILFINNIHGGSGPYLFSVDNQTYFTDSIISNLAPGIYNVEVIDSSQCSFLDEFEITELPELRIVYPNLVLNCEDDSILIEVALDGSSLDDVNWEWFNGAQTNSIYVSKPGTYSLKVSNNCQTLLEEINVYSEDFDDNSIFVPNAFTPNFDGINDVFQVYLSNDVVISKFHIEVFDRWGEQLYSSDDFNFRWDGYFKGKKLQMGVYVWHLEADLISCHNNASLQMKGDVTLLR